MALNELGARPEDAIIIGDRIYTDMQMGVDAGIRTALVLSGETKVADELPFPIDYILSNIGELQAVMDIDAPSVAR
jgi:ribonucleotide monophosphatase NagD (HAD superfamily)